MNTIQVTGERKMITAAATYKCQKCNDITAAHQPTKEPQR